MLNVSHVAFAYRKHPVLTDINLTAKEGDFVGILGKNGCGKSTLLSILAGVRKQNSGTLLWDDTPLFGHSAKPSDLVGYVPQLNPLLPELSVQDNLRLWSKDRSTFSEASAQLFNEMGLSDFMRTPVRKLSEGMKKRISLASVLQNSPKILILDESSAALDLACKEQIHKQLKAYTDHGGILLFTTHEESEFALCNRIYVMQDGVLVASSAEEAHDLLCNDTPAPKGGSHEAR